MSAKIKSSKIILFMIVLAAAAIVASYSVMSYNKTNNIVYYTELAVYTLAGILFSFGISFSSKGKKNITVPAGCVSMLMPAFVIPFLTVAYRNVPYLLQVSLYAKRTMTMVCPFFAIVLLKCLRSMTEGKRHGVILPSFSYFVITFAVIALLQGVVKWLYFFWYGIDTTWNAIETFYWVIAINAVYIWQVLRDTAGIADECRNNKTCRLLYALISDAAAVLVLIWRSFHIRSILHDFMLKLTQNGLGYALCNSTWLSYRLEILKGVINREYYVGDPMFLKKFPDEFPIRVLYTSEPLISICMTYGWAIMSAMLAVLAVLIVSLHTIGYKEKSNDEIVVLIRYSFTALCCLSFVSQMFVPVYGLIMPLMGNGACMIAVLVVYIALIVMKPKFTA